MKKSPIFQYIPLIILLLIGLFFSPSETLAFSGGSGTSEDPYMISTPDELNSLRNYTGSGYSNTYFQLANDIDMDVAPYNTGSGWVNISDDANKFYGHLDGDGHVISNLYINSSDRQISSFMGYIYTDASVENLILQDIDYSITGSPDSFVFAGGIAGKAYNSVIRNCGITGTLTVTVGNAHYAAGIAASMYNTTIENCYSDVEISATHYTGGLVGSGSGTVTNCYNRGSVSGSLYVAGIAGAYGGLTVTNSYSTGAISGSTYGALVSLNTGAGSVSDSYYNSETCGAGGTGTPKTTAEMKLQSTFSGWDFDSTWAIDGGNNDGYPFLQWEDLPPTAPPTVQASNITISETRYNQMKIAWTNGDGGRRQVFMKESSTGSASPVNSAGYTMNSSFGDGSQIGTSGWYTVYDGTGTTVTVTNLDPSTTYRIQVVEYNGSARNAWYLTETATNNPISNTTLALSAPTSQASDISFDSISHNKVTLSWQEGNGDYAVVFMRRGNSGTVDLTDDTTYTANSTLGDGDTVGSGWYAVYKGSGTSTTVYGLVAERDYIVQVVEYNGPAGSEKYLTSSATLNPDSFTTTEFVGEDDFETGDFSAFQWAHSGNDDWVISSEYKNSGSYSARSGPITHSQTSTLSITLTITEDGNISFYRKVSSESCCDGLKFYIDEDQKEYIRGDVDWTISTWPVTAGERTFTWTYYKDGSVSPGLDSGFIDDIVFPPIEQTNPPDHTLTYTAGSHGSLSGTASQTVTDGNNGSAVEAIPGTGYYFSQWSDGSTDNPRTDLDVGYDITVEAQFAINQYTLTYSAGSHGSISGSSSQTVNYGSSGSVVTAVPATGYSFKQWSDGSTTNPRTDTNITANKSVSAEFEINTYTVTYRAGTNGTITGISIQTVNYNGSSLRVLVIPKSGYQFVRWSDGSTANPRSDSNIKSDKDVTAIYTLMPIAEESTPSGQNLIQTLPETNDEEQEETEEEIEEQVEQKEETEELDDDEKEEIIKTKKYETEVYEKEGKKIIKNLIVRVEDEDGNPVAGVKVTLYSDPITAYTDDDGIAVFNDVPEGDHHVEVDYGKQKIKQAIAVTAPEVEELEGKDEGEVLSVEMDLLTITTETEQSFPRWILYIGLVVLSVVTIYFLMKVRRKTKE
jgi:hypothetical protein